MKKACSLAVGRDQEYILWKILYIWGQSDVALRGMVFFLLAELTTARYPESALLSSVVYLILPIHNSVIAQAYAFRRALDFPNALPFLHIEPAHSQPWNALASSLHTILSSTNSQALYRWQLSSCVCEYVDTLVISSQAPRTSVAVPSTFDISTVCLP